MPQLHFVTLDVFTTTRYLGNPLALVQIPAGQEISTEQMQGVAREFNLSETLFLHEQKTGSDNVPEWRVRIFVTYAEIPFAGHPTIGASCYTLGTLAEGSPKGRLICNAGPIEVDYADGVAKASIPHNFHHHTQYPVTVEDVLTQHPSLKETGVEPIDVALTCPVKGMNFLNIQLPDLETLGKITLTGLTPTYRLDDKFNEGIRGSFLYVITNEPSKEEAVVKLRTRMLIGSRLEDPATGSASSGLCAYIALKLKLARTTRFVLTQAVEMGRQSDIGVVLTLNEKMDAIERIDLSGSAVKVMEGVIEV